MRLHATTSVRPSWRFANSVRQTATFASLGITLDYAQVGVQTRDLGAIVADSLYYAIIQLAHPAMRIKRR